MKKRNIFIAVVLIIASASVYGFMEYNRTAEDLLYAKAKYTITAAALIESFAKDELTANKQYLGQVVAVTGSVRNIETDAKNNFIIVLGDKASSSSVRCNIDSAHTAAIVELNEGTGVTVKGLLTGYNADETGLLGSDVQINRCVIYFKK